MEIKSPNNYKEDKMLKTSKLLMILILLSTFLLLNAQEKKDPVSKLMKLKGEVENITIKTDKETIELTGAEAEKLLKKIKRLHKHNNKKLVWITEDDEDIIHTKNLQIKKRLFHSHDDEDNLRIFISKHDDEDNDFLFLDKKTIELIDGDIEIEVENMDGELTVKEIIEKDGKKEIKTYKGKEAEEFLKEKKLGIHEDCSEKHKRIKINVKKDKDKKIKETE